MSIKKAIKSMNFDKRNEKRIHVVDPDTNPWSILNIWIKVFLLLFCHELNEK